MRDTYPQIHEEYIETGKIRYATLDLPLESIHKLAFKAAQATECAREQDKFHEMHARLFENQSSLEPFGDHAVALGLDAAAFDSCMSSEAIADAVRNDMAEAQKAGATGTPSFVLAKTGADPSKVEGITFIRGAQGFNSFKAAIDAELGESD